MQYILLANRDGYTVDKVWMSEEGIVSVTLSIDNEIGTAQRLMNFHRDKCWAVRDVREESTSLSLPEEVSIAVHHCTYDGDVGGIPLLQSFVYETIWRSPETTGGDRITLQRVFDINAVTAGPPPLEEFDVHHFIKQIGAESNGHYFRFGWLFVGILLLFVGVSLRRKRRERVGA